MLTVLATVAVPTRTVIAQDSVRAVRGVVTDTRGRPIPFANVLLNARRVAADDSGHFRIAAPASRNLHLEIRKIGFRPEYVTLAGLPDTSIRVVLTPLAQQLQEITITTERTRSLDLHGFYGRMAEREKGLNTGHFITPEDLERRNYPKITRMMEGLPSVRIANGGTILGGIPMGTTHGRCVMQTYVNGGRVQVFKDQDILKSDGTGSITKLVFGDPVSSTDAGQYPGLDNFISTNTVAGIEVYPRGTGAPPQYQLLNGSCGVILIWTK